MIGKTIKFDKTLKTGNSFVVGKGSVLLQFTKNTAKIGNGDGCIPLSIAKNLINGKFASIVDDKLTKQDGNSDISE